MLEVLYKDGCEPCNKLKMAMSRLNIGFEPVHVGSNRGGELIQKLRKEVRHPTVPAVFRNDKYLGDSTISVTRMSGLL